MYAAINLLNSYTGINILSCFKSIFCCFKIYYIREIYICVYIQVAFKSTVCKTCFTCYQKHAI